MALSRPPSGTQMLPAVPHGWLIQQVSSELVDQAAACGFEMLCARANALSAEGVQLARSRGLAVRAWGVRTLEVRGSPCWQQAFIHKHMEGAAEWGRLCCQGGLASADVVHRQVALTARLCCCSLSSNSMTTAGTARLPARPFYCWCAGWVQIPHA